LQPKLLSTEGQDGATAADIAEAADRSSTAHKKEQAAAGDNNWLTGVS
jgi:hypothetical protein